VEILYVLVPIALLFVFIAVRILFWAINNGQYDDLNTEANRILFDDLPAKKKRAVDASVKSTAPTQSDPPEQK